MQTTRKIDACHVKNSLCVRSRGHYRLVQVGTLVDDPFDAWSSALGPYPYPPAVDEADQHRAPADSEKLGSSRPYLGDILLGSRLPARIPPDITDVDAIESRLPRLEGRHGAY